MKSSELRAASAYFALVFGTGFVLGSIRVPLLVPRLGERAAELLEMPFMMAAIYFAARFTVRRFALPPSSGVRLRVGLLALALLVAIELALAATLRGLSPTELVASRDPVSGGVYLGLLMLFALMPRLLARGKTGRAATLSSH